MPEFKQIARKSVGTTEWSKLDKMRSLFPNRSTFCGEGASATPKVEQVKQVKQVVLTWNNKSQQFDGEFMVSFSSSPSSATATVVYVESSAKLKPGSKPWMALLVAASKFAHSKAKAIRVQACAHQIYGLHRLGFVVSKPGRSLSFTEPESVKRAISRAGSTGKAHPSHERACMDINSMFMLQAIIDAKLVPDLSHSISTMAEKGVPMFFKI